MGDQKGNAVFSEIRLKKMSGAITNEDRYGASRPANGPFAGPTESAAHPSIGPVHRWVADLSEWNTRMVDLYSRYWALLGVFPVDGPYGTAMATRERAAEEFPSARSEGRARVARKAPGTPTSSAGVPRRPGLLRVAQRPDAGDLLSMFAGVAPGEVTAA